MASIRFADARSSQLLAEALETPTVLDNPGPTRSSDWPLHFLRNIQRINWMILAPSLVGDLTINSREGRIEGPGVNVLGYQGNNVGASCGKGCRSHNTKNNTNVTGRAHRFYSNAVRASVSESN
jgi:hypothetical protein